MVSNLVELVNEYYAARKPYTQLVREAHANLPSSPNSSPKTCSTSTAGTSSDTVQSHQQQESDFSLNPKIPHDEIKEVLQKLEAARIQYAEGEKSTGKAAAGKKK